MDRWIADLDKLELSERQPDNSYRVAYKMIPFAAPQVVKPGKDGNLLSEVRTLSFIRSSRVGCSSA